MKITAFELDDWHSGNIAIVVRSSDYFDSRAVPPSVGGSHYRVAVDKVVSKDFIKKLFP